MRFEYLVLLILAFNVITALLKNRAKKAKAEFPAEVRIPEPAPDRLKERVAANEAAKTPERRESKTSPAPAQAKVRAEASRSRTGTGASPLRNSLLGKDRLREAFILKEILDLPLARRGRRG